MNPPTANSFRIAEKVDTMNRVFSTTGFSLAIALAALALAAGATVTHAQAQGRDRCNDYANEMISIDQRARQTRCAGWRSHSNYQNHYNWCQGRPPGAAQKALADWGTGLQRCQFAASGSPAARAQLGQADPAFCRNVYGPQLTQIWAQAQSRGCRGFVGRNNNFDGHVQWCMGRPKPVAERAIADNRRGAAACR
jgi:hypothetical protein